MENARQKLKRMLKESNELQQREQETVLNVLQKQYSDVHRTKVHIIKTMNLQEKQIQNKIESAKKNIVELQTAYQRASQ